jgi:hypothetical protein
MGRPTVEPHFGSIVNPKSFEEAYKYIDQNKNKIYRTNTGKEFTAESRITINGINKGKKVIVFKRFGRESSRSYECCWGARTNCNRTYIDIYTIKI